MDVHVNTTGMKIEELCNYINIITKALSKHITDIAPLPSQKNHDKSLVTGRPHADHGLQHCINMPLRCQFPGFVAFKNSLNHSCTHTHSNEQSIDQSIDQSANKYSFITAGYGLEFQSTSKRLETRNLWEIRLQQINAEAFDQGASIALAISRDVA